ncbi:hypothetical protein SAMN04487974_101732 [Pelagibacterium luteolum]|uniref:Uncharacterized protein n=1 Tax=Pelagibacterium luteolum TaxID=440168 RepID=A0A1G7SUK6_9HYPH|nr:hypothetical protein SAMN04487974_101732 [Pelagibacterium luteolum]
MPMDAAQTLSEGDHSEKSCDQACCAGRQNHFALSRIFWMLDAPTPLVKHTGILLES